MSSDHAPFAKHPAYSFDRRVLLRGAFLLVGGLGIAPTVLAATGALFFTPAERGTLDLVSDTIIPRTDTPGAIDAGVPAFLDALMANWASAASRDRIRGAIARLASAAQTDTGKPIARLSAAERTAWLTRQDAALLVANDAGYNQLKHLVLTSYYYSEAGATQELRYELVPGVWEPSVPITADTRAWAA